MATEPIEPQSAIPGLFSASHLRFYVGDVLHGDLGPSLKYQDKPVARLIAGGFTKSVAIGLFALVLATGLGLALNTNS